MDREQVDRREPPSIPGYRIEGVLGRGATGTVYKARQLSVDRLVALKVLHPDLVGAKGAETRLQREARATARLAHPHIISAFDMGAVDGVWWYAMELVDGMSLAERIREKPLSEREALRTFIPLVEALQHAFERGIVHRDIKPANILVERGGRALLVDLGLAFAGDDPLVTKSGATLGTPHYISPEQARDPSQADAQSDLWSLGATMYHAVCGRPPFAGESVAEILSAVLYSPVPDPAQFAPQIGKGFALILRKCLARDRALRYQTPGELLLDLERVRERRAPLVRRAALEPVAGGRARWIRAGTVAAAGLALVVALVWLVNRDAEPGGRADAGPGAAAVLDPVDRLLYAAEGPASELGSALVRAVQLVRTLPPDSESALRAANARAHLEARLAAEIRRFQIGAESRFEAALSGRRFDDVEALVTDGLRREFLASVGGAALPPDLSESMRAWTDGLAQRFAAARRAAEEEYRAALRAAWETRVEPVVRQHLEAGRWRSARALLTTEVRAWAEDPALPRAGVPVSAVETALGRLRELSLDPLRADLDRRWEALDADLKAWVARRASELRGALEGRTLSDAAAVLRAEWNLELQRRQLTVEEMPAGLLHLGHEELVKAERELSELARALATEDARKGLIELAEEAQPLWRTRRYAEVARLWEQALADAWRQPVHDEIELRAREARMLAHLLKAAADNVARREGERIELRLSTIVLAGKIVAGPDPLERGFALLLDSGRTYALALRSASGAEGATVVSREVLEELAGLGAGAEDRLARALLRLREGEPTAAREALNSGVLPREEPLVADAERRVRQALEARRDAVQERRALAQERYHLALREGREGQDPERLGKRIERLLREDAEFLTPDEVQELRRLRDERLAEAAPKPPSLDDLLRPNVLEPLAGGRVRLRYEFDRPRAGGFDSGAWISDGQGWIALRYALSDDEVLARIGPNIVLREPVQVQNDPIDLRLRFQHRPDAPPELLLVSCAGFHVVLVGSSGGRSARCLVDTGDPAQVVARARKGEGRDVSGPGPGQAFELRVTVSRARGVATIEIDGRRPFDVQRPAPRGDMGDRLIAVRSFEPVRLLAATIEVAAR